MAVVAPAVRRTGALLAVAGLRAVLRADTVPLADFFAAPVRVVLRAAVLRPPACRELFRDAVFRVDLPAERAPPRAVLRADDLDRLLDDALRLAMSVILVYLP